MKILYLAQKDLTRSFRSVFAVVFMFGIPLLVTGMFYLMFGGMKDSGTGFNLPPTSVVIANLDEGSPDLPSLASQFPADANIRSMGDMVVYVLRQEQFEPLMQLSLVQDALAARAAVQAEQAGVAVIIPADFSSQYASLDGQAVLEVYQDPTLTLGPAIVRSVLDQFMDGLAGAKIALRVAASQTGSGDPALLGRTLAAYLSASAEWRDPSALLEVRHPAQAQAEEIPLLERILGPIMGGMIIFYAYYTGTATAESLLAEDELGTLPRLFTTPTRQSTILGGKLLAVLLTVTIQVVVLLVLGRVVFGIAWGSPAAVLVFAVGTILSASAFGVFVNSLMKSTKQGGIVFGGILTFSGMLGMMPIFLQAAGSIPDVVKTISLCVPQGWAVRGLLQSMQGSPSTNLLPTLGVLLTWAVGFFVIGVLRFQKRYA